MAISAYTASKSELITYIKQMLGYPVINIEVSDDQVEHAINKALRKFIDFADDGNQIRFSTQAVVSGTQSYTLDFNVYSIIDVYDVTNISVDAVFPDHITTQLYGTKLVASDMLTLELTRRNLSQFEHMSHIKLAWDYNSSTNTLYLIAEPTASETIGLLYYEKIDYSDNDSGIYDHPWIKAYSTALTKYQWAWNLTKYEGSILPSGLTMNAATMLSESKEDIEKLELELQEVWRLPSDFFVG